MKLVDSWREAFDCRHIQTKELDQENEVGRWSLKERNT